MRVVSYVQRRPVVFSFVTLVAVAVVVLGVLGYAVSANRDAVRANRVLAKEGKIAHDSLCAFKDDLRRRIDDGRAFIKNPPRNIIGIPVTDEVLAQAKASLANQLATYQALGDLNCSPDDLEKGEER